MGKKDIKSEMGEFIPESVGAALTKTVKDNKPFIVTEHAKKYYIAMLLDVTKIGGINKKSVNDKDKGGVIEAIKSGHIDAYVTQELNDANQLMFIPTYNTIDRLGDYGLFRKVDGYEFVKLNDKLEIVSHTGVYGTYDEFRAICTGQTDIKEYVKPEDVIIAGSEEDPTAPHGVASKIAQAADTAKNIASNAVSTVAPVVGKLAEKVKDKISESTGIKDMQEAPPEEKQETAAQDPEPQPQAAETAQEQQTESAENTEADEQEIVYTETQVINSIERIFHADNLDLPLSSEPFDQLFTLNNHLIKFDLDPRDSYVTTELNRMAADANRELMKLRADNINALRSKYVMLMTVRIQELQTEFDTEDQTTRYGSMKASIDATKKSNLDNIARTIEERQQTLKDAYETRLNEHCENASRAARADFKARYQRQHNDDLNAIEGKVRAEITATYNEALNELYQIRRSDALTALDINVTGVLNELTEDYKKMFDAENALYLKFADEMREYAKQLHLDDAKRLAVEEEQLRITNEVNDARAEAAAKIALIQREFETTQAAIEARSEATIAQANNENRLLKEQMDARTATLEQDKERLQRQLDDAIERADKAQEVVRADYEHRLAQAQDDRDSWKQTLETYKEQHKHNNILAAILVVAIVIASLAGGFVSGGVYWNRVVSNELSGNQGDVEIKVINPEENFGATAETESLLNDENENESDTENISEENSDDLSENEASVTSIPDEDAQQEDETDITTSVADITTVTE